jgi:hypothetical protein
MRTSVSPNSTWEPWEAASAPGEVQVRLGQRYQGQLGFRRLLLAETLIALMQQQMPSGLWRLRSATVKFVAEPSREPASVVTVHRSVFPGSMLANVRLVQHARMLGTCVGAFERDWRPALTQRPAPPALGAPDRLPKLQNWPEDAENDCRDASSRLWPAGAHQMLGGFARHREPKSFGAEHVCTLLEPWASMPDPEGRWREIDEVVLEMHTPRRSGETQSAGYYQVLVERREWSPEAERLVGSIWSPAGKAVATAHLTTHLTG